MMDLHNYEVWLVAGSQEMYGVDVLAQVQRHAEDVARGLDRSHGIPVRVVSKGVLATPEQIAARCHEANASPRCVGVIAWMHTFSPGRMWLRGLSALEKPLLHLHTQYAAALPWGEIDMDFMNLNQSAHGDREFAHVLSRIGHRRKTIAGHWADPVVQQRIGSWTRAACGWNEAQQLRVARFGDNMRDVAVTDGDKFELQLRLGTSVNGYGLTDLGAALDDVTDVEVDVLVDEYDDSYTVAPILRRGGDAHGSLRDAARIELALRGFLGNGGFGAFTDTFQDVGRLPQLPGLAVQRLMADGYGFGPEGDWKTAALLRVAKTMAAGLPGGTTFMEDYTYDMEPGNGTILGSHMLEVCPSIADGRPTCEIHPLSIGGKADPVRLVFTAAPGPGTIVSIADFGERFRMVANTVEIVAPPAPLPKLPVARALWKPLPDFSTALEGWLMAGAPHHTVLTTAIGLEPFADFAELAGIELLAIDEGTTIPRLRDELRWNDAHYRTRGPR